MSTDPARVAGERHRRSVATREGVVSCLDTGGPGPTAVFVHGVGTNAHLWRHVLPEVSDLRRCVAVDLPLHGRTPVRPGQDLSLPGLAAVVAAVCEELGAGPVDLVANDTGGAVAQVLASRRPELVASLALTNCEVHDNIPPKAFGPTITLARTGLLARLGPRLLRDPERARARVFGSGYQDVRRLPLDVVTDFLRPVLGTREAGRVFQRLLLALRPGDLVAAEAGLRRLEVPALLVWGTDDPFFAVSWAHRLAATLPGAREPVLVDGGRLFLPDERAAELVAALRAHWGA